VLAVHERAAVYAAALSCFYVKKQAAAKAAACNGFKAVV